jgi:hypothetical protein
MLEAYKAATTPPPSMTMTKKIVVGSQCSWYNLDGKYREDEGCLIHVSSLIQTVFIIFVILLIDTRLTQNSFYLLLLQGVVGSCMNMFFVDDRFIHQLLYLWLMLGLTSTTYWTIVIQIFASLVLIDLHFVWFYRLDVMSPQLCYDLEREG